MSPRCARPGCGAVATAWLSYDYARQQAWLDDPDPENGGHHCALCPLHAARLRPPLGWTYYDRRTLPPTAAPAAPPGVRAREAPPAIAV